MYPYVYVTTEKMLPNYNKLFSEKEKSFKALKWEERVI